YSAPKAREYIFHFYTLFNAYLFFPFCRVQKEKRPLLRALSAGLAAGFGQLYNFCEKENFSSLQISRQGHHGGEDGQGGGLAAEDAGAEADGPGAGGGSGRRLFGGETPFGAGHNGDAQRPVRRGGRGGQQLPQRRAAALVAEQHQVVLVKGA